MKKKSKTPELPGKLPGMEAIETALTKAVDDLTEARIKHEQTGDALADAKEEVMKRMREAKKTYLRSHGLIFEITSKTNLTVTTEKI